MSGRPLLRRPGIIFGRVQRVSNEFVPRLGRALGRRIVTGCGFAIMRHIVADACAIRIYSIDERVPSIGVLLIRRTHGWLTGLGADDVTLRQRRTQPDKGDCQYWKPHIQSLPAPSNDPKTEGLRTLTFSQCSSGTTSTTLCQR